nr:uncharacterized mitochondrial protein AtMg00810-like [Tanacetum cinerariifolium]
MHEKFQMSAMGELNFFLGLQVLHKEDGIFLSQDKYVGDILKKFGYSDVRSSNTPMDKENPWGKDGTKKDVDLHLYKSMIGSLMYLTASRPDIMFVVCAYARHQVTPKECHLHAVKRIFRYLKVHPKLGLWYPKESPFDLVAYSDSDYGGATQDRKSTTEGCQFLGRRLISWQCKKQKIVATSTTEVEHAMYGFFKGNLIIYTTFVSHTLFGWGIGTSKYWGVLRVLMVHLRLIPLFWSTARIETTKEGTKILATIDGMLRTMSESSIRRNLKLNDEAGISSLPDAELFENLTQMGYNISPNQKFTFQKGQFSRQRARIAQSSALPPVADEPASPIGDDSQGEACPTDSSLEADQDRANIPKTSTFPSDSTPSLQRQQSEMISKFGAQELEINKLKAIIKLLEDKDRGVAKQSGDDAPIKGSMLDEGEEAAKRVSDDTEEMATVLTSIDAASILTSGGVQVVPTAAEVATATIARDAEIARIHAEEELQMLIDGLNRNNETVAKYLQEYYQFAAEFPIERRIELISDLDSSKKLKTLEDVPEEKLKEMMELIPVEE